MCMPVIVPSDCLASEVASFIPLIEFADPFRATSILLNLFFNIYIDDFEFRCYIF